MPAIAPAQGFNALGPIASAGEVRKGLAEAAAEVQARGRRLIDVSIEGDYEDKYTN